MTNLNYLPSQVTLPEFPRVLVVGASSLSRSDATGITLANLFAGWPIGQIAQIYDSASPPDSDICPNAFRFSSDDIYLIRTAKQLARTFRKSEWRLDSHKHLQPSAASIRQPVTHPRFWACCGDAAPFRLPIRLIEWIAAFRPDVIYSVLGSVRMMNIVLQISQRFDLPIVPHFMDDWPTTAYGKAFALDPMQCLLNTKLHAILQRSPFGMTICEDMATEYSQRYKKRFERFMNCVDLEAANANRSESQEAISFGYFGGLHLNRWRSLLHVAEALERLRDDDRQITLEIFAPPKDVEHFSALFHRFDVVRSVRSIAPESVTRKLGNFDVLLHVESFDPEDSYYTRLSVSTKIPQYMAAGRSILAIGPANLSSIRYVEKTGAGIAVTNEDLTLLSEAAEKLVNSETLRHQLGSAGRAHAAEHHSAVVERNRFLMMLRSASFTTNGDTRWH